MFAATNLASAVLIAAAASSAAAAHVCLSADPPVSPRLTTGQGLLAGASDAGAGLSDLPASAGSASLVGSGADLTTFTTFGEPLNAMPDFVVPELPVVAGLEPQAITPPGAFVYRIVHFADGDRAVCSYEKDFVIPGADAGAGAVDVSTRGVSTVPTPSAAALFGVACTLGCARRRRF